MRVLLVAMPFGKIDRPSIALGLLKAALAREHVDCDVAYLNLAFAAGIGAQSYDRVAGARQRTLAGDWVFAGCLYDGAPQREGDYVERVLRAEWRLGEEDIEAVLAARAFAPRFLEGVLTDLRWADYALVGFTCSFGQTVPSLALARLLKQRYRHLLTIFGGPAWHDIMGRTLFASFPFVDAACLGEGDASFPALARGIAADGLDGVRQIPGMLVRDSCGDVNDGGAERPVDDLDQLPIPDYADYSTAISGWLGEPPDGAVVVPAETSRGCWWSVRGPCTFCGIVGPHRNWRTKSRARILQELRALAAHPGCRLVEVVDNVAAPALLAGVLPELVLDPLPAHLDVDIRPDAGRRTVELLAETGTHTLTGIESLSERLLAQMNKGTHALENVRFLKWCKTLGVQVRWNLLCGFPGETAADYEELMHILRAIVHLDAPVTCATVDVERFSSYFDDPETYGFTNLRPAAAYRYVFPLDDETVRDIAYFFDHDFMPGSEPSDGSFHLRRLVYDWQHDPACRELRLREGGRTLVDTRRPEARQIHRLDDIERRLYLACEDIRSRDELEEDVRRSGIDGDGLAARVDAALGRFMDSGLMLRRDDLYLSLALPETAPPRSRTAASPEKGLARPPCA
jgi:ribosomal peptide maturation radical SAM protein 1